MEQPVHRALADAVAARRSASGTVTPQRTLRIAARHRFKLARRHQTRIRCARRRGDANVLKESHSKTPNQAPPARTVPIPVASATRLRARWASVAAHRRRARSFRTGRNTTNLDRSVSTIASMTSLIADPHQKTIYFGENPTCDFTASRVCAMSPCTARLGWSAGGTSSLLHATAAEQQCLHLIANNSRFVGGMPNLACLRRLDIEAARSSRRCSSSASPEPAIARRTGARLTLGRERLRALPSPRPGDLHVRTGTAGTRSRRAQHDSAGPRLRSLCLGEVCRKRYPLRTILAARRLPRRDRIRRPPGTACGGELVLQPEALHRTHTFHTILADLPPETLPCGRPGSRHAGKDIRGASSRERPAGRSGRARMVLGQAKSNEIPSPAASTSPAASSPWMRCTLSTSGGFSSAACRHGDQE